MGNKSTMKQLTAIIEKCSVKSISINNCRIGDYGGIAIAAGCSHKSRLREINLRFNEFSDLTAKAFAEVID